MFRKIKSLLLFCLLIVSWDSYSLSCSKIPEHFYFSCVGGECKPEFQVSSKTVLGGCKSRTIVSEPEQEFRRYLKSQVQELQVDENGIYKLSVKFRYWTHTPNSDLDDFLAAMKKEYGYLFEDYETGEVPSNITIKRLIEFDSHYVSWRFISEQADLNTIKHELLTLQFEGLLQSIIYNTVYWGGFLLCSVFSVYSTNRFYKVLNVKEKADWLSLLIQLLILVICFITVWNTVWHPWVGGILMPFLIIILVSELFAVLQMKMTKKMAARKRLHKT